ncbi:7278_t:CDS:2 [Acaulospora colombiana]|uniref:7278_t:CDS:1 n=1 Tax=Acaulospora colombiana TaxID=27376 RepID=A0ACA9LIN6_9GLOM|nr:7278_t:CDS:2 [Acaulospora colombiana]
MEKWRGELLPFSIILGELLAGLPFQNAYERKNLGLSTYICKLLAFIERMTIQKVAHDLGGEQHLEHTEADQRMFVIEAGDPILEKPGGESSFRHEEDDAFWLVWDARSPVGSTVSTGATKTRPDEKSSKNMQHSLDDDNVGNKDEEEREHGKETQSVEEEELGLGGDRQHGQQGVRVGLLVKRCEKINWELRLKERRKERTIAAYKVTCGPPFSPQGTASIDHHAHLDASWIPVITPPPGHSVKPLPPFISEPLSSATTPIVLSDSSGGGAGQCSTHNMIQSDLLCVWTEFRRFALSMHSVKSTAENRYYSPYNHGQPFVSPTFPRISCVPNECIFKVRNKRPVYPEANTLTRPISFTMGGVGDPGEPKN